MNQKLSIITVVSFASEFVFVRKRLLQLGSFDTPYTWILVYNGSQDDITYAKIKELVKDESGIQLLCTDGYKSLALARNMAIQMVSTSYIMFADSDIELRETALSSLQEFLDSNKEVGVVAPEILYEDGKNQDVYRRFPTFWDLVVKRSFLRRLPWFRERHRYYLMWDKNPEVTEAVDWVEGSAIMVRKSFFDELQGFDERYFRFMEDTDLCRRMWQNKHMVYYYPRTTLLHYRTKMEHHKGLVYTVTHKESLIHLVSACKYFLKFGFTLRKNPRRQFLYK